MTNNEFAHLYVGSGIGVRGLPTPLSYQETALACHAFLRKGLLKAGCKFTSLDGCCLGRLYALRVIPWEG